MYVSASLQEELRQPIWGWLGRRDPFEMAPGYDRAGGMRGYLSGTPPVLGLVAVEEGVRVVGEAGMAAIREKGIRLSELAIALADSVPGVSVASPRDSQCRGAHVALVHPGARELCRALIDTGVIVDYRSPDIIRFGFAPLTTRYVDVWDGIEAVRRLLGGG
jgi:kynureninase